MTTTSDTHDGLTCQQVEALLDLRVAQLNAARNELADAPRATTSTVLVAQITAANRELRTLRAEVEALRDRLAWREDQATKRLTVEEQRAEHLAAVAGIEAVIAGDQSALDAVAPKTIAAMRAQMTALMGTLVDICSTYPDVTAKMRSSILAAGEEAR